MPIGPFAVLVTRPKSRGKITYPHPARCARRHLLRPQKRLLLAVFAPRLPSLVFSFYHFRRFRLSGLWHLILKVLRAAERESVGRDPQPTVAIMDSQSAKTTEESAHLRGYDPHKNVKGRKRHILVDTLSLLLSVYVNPADVQDRGGAHGLLGG
jgi:transposase